MRTPSLLPSTRRRCLQLGVGWVLAAGLGACKHIGPPLRLGSIAFAGYEPVFVAREQGWLDESLVRLVELHSNTDALRALAAGQLEAAQLTLDEFLSARGDGLDLRILAVLDVSAGADVVIARSGLRDPDRVRGRRIGVEEGAVGAIMLGAFLRSQRLQVADVETVSVALGHNVEAFRNAEADFFVTAEPWATQLEQWGGVRVFDSTAMPGRIVDVLVARADALAPHEPALRALLAAHFRAVEWIHRHPELAGQAMAPRMQLAPDAVMATLKGLEQPDAHKSFKFLQADGLLLRNIKELEQVMLQDGLIAQAFSTGTLFEPRFHPL